MCLLFSSYYSGIFFIQCSLIFPFDPLLGHDFLHVYIIISKMLAEEFDSVYQTMVFTLYHSCKLEVPKMWESGPVLQFGAFCIFYSHI